MQPKHIATCASSNLDSEGYQCTTGDFNHNWSGWPGAHCLKCGIHDLAEECLGGCHCHCHDEFWAQYAKDVADGII